jgi:selenocysteine-specific elongation factor
VRSRAETSGQARLHIDRVFTIRGAGTVVTGTLWSGSVAPGEELELLPSGRRVRVRGVQVHDRVVETAAAGQRVAVNLAGLAVAEVERGDVLVSRGSEIEPTYLIDAELDLGAREPEPGARIQVHHGTRETPARLAWLGGRFWQLRLEQPLVPVAGDRLVIRQIAPPDTLGGGVVLDGHPKKHGPSRDLLARLGRLARGERVEDEGESNGTSADDQPGGRGSRQHAPPVRLSSSALALEQRFKAAGLEPPIDSELDPDDLRALRDAGRAVRVSRNLHYHPSVLEDVRRRLIALAELGGGTITLAALRDELGTSRKFAQALLEHFDSEKLTIRKGDEHILRRSARAL